MAYMKKKYRNILEKVEKEIKLPKGWRTFVNKEANKDGIIVKTKGTCICVNCQTNFKSNKRINEKEKCPKCRNEYLIKRKTCKWHIFEPRRLIILDRVEEMWIVRLFELYSSYRNGKITHSDASEYGRIILPEDLNFVNNRVYSLMWGNDKVKTNEKIKSWRFYRNNTRLSAEGKLFYYNLKEIFQNTEYKYSQLWTLAKKLDNINIAYYLNNNLLSTEILIKMGLYNLALCPRTFNIEGNFEKRFGIDKSYYKFMKTNNINIDELNVLKLYKKKNIEAIKYLKNFSLEYLKQILKYMSLDKFYKYARSKKHFDSNLYLDYIGFLEDLQIDTKNKAFLFPENIKEAHDTYEKQVSIKKDEITKRKFTKRYEELEKNIFYNNRFFIRPAQNIKELEDESRQQKNCVRTYAQKYANGKCDIYFMREKDSPNKSLVTVEVCDNKVVQSRIKRNEAVNKIQKRFLDKWEKEILNAA